MNRRVGLATALLAGGAMSIAGCAPSGDAESKRAAQRQAASPSASAPPVPSAPATRAPAPSPTATPPQARRKLRPGDRNADVKALQRRLEELNYDPGKIDGKYGPATQQAVWAFQKVNRLKIRSTLGERTGIVDQRLHGAAFRLRPEDVTIRCGQARPSRH